MIFTLGISPSSTNTPAASQFVHSIIRSDCFYFVLGCLNFLGEFFLHLHVNFLGLFTQGLDYVFSILQTFTTNIHFQLSDTKIKLKIKTRVKNLSNETLPRINICFLESSIPLLDMIGHFFLLLTHNLCGLNRVGNIAHDSHDTTINSMVITREIAIIIIKTANPPAITADDNVGVAILMILQIISDTPFKDGFHSKIVEDSLSLISKLLKVMLLNGKTNLKTIRLRCIRGIEKIQSRNTTLVNRCNIGILLTVVI